MLIGARGLVNSIIADRGVTNEAAQ